MTVVSVFFFFFYLGMHVYTHEGALGSTFLLICT